MIIFLTIYIGMNYYIIMELNVNKIKMEMVRLGWSNSELARRMGKHREWVFQLLKNSNKSRTFRTVEAIAKALEIDPKDLIK